MRSCLLICSAFCLLVTLAEHQAQAQTSQLLDGYHVRQWTVADGLPVNHVDWLEISPDGFVWMGTGQGLVRFDGLRFDVFDAAGIPEWSESYVRQMSLSGGRLIAWPRSDSGLEYSLVSHHFEPNELGPAAMLAYIHSYAGMWARGPTRDALKALGLTAPVDPPAMVGPATINGSILLLGDSTVYRVEPGVLEALRPIPTGFLPTREGGYRAPDGSLWYKSADTWVRFDGEDFETVTDGWAVMSHLAGRLFVGQTGRISEWVDGQLVTLHLAIRPVNLTLPMLMGDSRGTSWWVERPTRGGDRLVRHLGSTTYSVDLGDTDILAIRAVREDREGTIWVATDRGLISLRPAPFSVIGRKHGLDNLLVKALAENDAGAVWAGTWGGGVFALRSGAAVHVPLDLTLIHTIQSTEDGHWLVGGSGGVVEALPNGEVLRRIPLDGRTVLASSGDTLVGRPLRRLDGGSERALSHLQVWTLFKDRSEGVWVGAEEGLYRLDGDSLVRDPRVEGWVVSMTERDEGGFWIGTNGGGLLLLDAQGASQFTAADGLVSDGIWCVVEEDGYLWMSSDQGLSRVSVSSLDGFLNNAGPIDAWTLTEGDGLPSREFNRGGPSCLRRSDGRLLFGSVGGVVVVDPGDFSRVDIAPPVLVTDISVDGIAIASSGPLELPPGSHNIAISFTALSFLSPAHNQFRYAFGDGTEPLSAPSTQRSVTLRGVDRGEHVFRLTASNGKGTWSADEIGLHITVRSAWHQLMWVRVLGLVALVSLFGGPIIVLLKGQRKQAIADERVRIASDLHDELGSRLGALSLRLDLLDRKTKADPDLQGMASELAVSARAISAQFRDVIWLVDAEHDHLGNLVDRFGEHLDKTLPRGGWDISESGCRDQTSLKGSWRRHVFLSFKEAVFNALRHAEASRISVSVSMKQGTFALQVRDDGVGFDPTEAHSGSGLESLERRSQHLGGTARWTSSPGEGTIFNLEVPLRP